MESQEAERLPPGEKLAHDLHAAIMETNRILGDIKELLKASAQREEKLAEVIDEACDYMEVGVTAVDILTDISGNGKSLTSKDVVKSIQSATKEVFGDDGGGDDDDGGDDGRDDDDGKDPAPIGGEGRRRTRRS